MIVHFHFRISAADQSITVTQDGRVPGAYSQFSRCTGHPFSHWAGKLPEYCRHEANGPYRVRCTCDPIQGEILRFCFEGAGDCLGFQLQTPLISQKNRLLWADRLAEVSAAVLPPLVLRIEDRGSHALSLSENRIPVWAEVPHLPIKLTRQACGIPLCTFLSGPQAFEASAGTSGQQEGVWLVDGRSEYRCIGCREGNFLFEVSQPRLRDFLLHWFLEFCFPRYCSRLLPLFSSNARILSHPDPLVPGMLYCLTSNRPFLRLAFPDRMELHDSAPIRVYRLPENMKCSITTSTPGATQIGSDLIIHPRAEGPVTIRAYALDSPDICTEKTVLLYLYRRVSHIRLSPPAQLLLEGDSFRIQADFQPANADNLHTARWSVQPSDSLQMTAPGCFRAEKSGPCLVTVQVEGATGQIRLQIARKARGVYFPLGQLQIRDGDSSAAIAAKKIPADSQGAQIHYRVQDPHILDYNSRTGAIHPLQEGQTRIIATLTDSSGAVIGENYCSVTVLPAREVITPDPALVLFILGLVGMLCTLTTELWPLMDLTAIAGAAWFSLRKKSLPCYILSATVSVLLVMLLF